eukprot:3626471-Alexandrium_andersonii.AAC.1
MLYIGPTGVSVKVRVELGGSGRVAPPNPNPLPLALPPRPEQQHCCRRVACSWVGKWALPGLLQETRAWLSA